MAESTFSKNLAFAGAFGGLLMAAGVFLTWISGVGYTGWELSADSPDLYSYADGTAEKAGSFCMQIPAFMLAFGIIGFLLELYKAAGTKLSRPVDSVVTSTAAFLGVLGIILAAVFASWGLLGGDIGVPSGSYMQVYSGCGAGIGVWTALAGSVIMTAFGIWEAYLAFTRPADGKD
jgi:hypothetical protein